MITDSKRFENMTVPEMARFMRLERPLLGLGEITTGDIEKTVNVMSNSCPSATVQEAAECLFENLIDCPDGVRLDMLQMLCRISPDIQKGLINRTHKIIDKQYFVRFLLSPTGANVIVDPFQVNSFTTITGVTNFANDAKLIQELPFCVSGISLKYGTITTPAAISNTDPALVQYGLILDELVGTTRQQRVNVPPSILNGELTLSYGSAKMLNQEPLTFMNNFNADRNSIGYKRLSNLFLAEGSEAFSAQFKFGVGFTPPAGESSYLELVYNGAAVIKIQ